MRQQNLELPGYTTTNRILELTTLMAADVAATAAPRRLPLLMPLLLLLLVLRLLLPVLQMYLLILALLPQRPPLLLLQTSRSLYNPKICMHNTKWSAGHLPTMLFY